MSSIFIFYITFMRKSVLDKLHTSKTSSTTTESTLCSSHFIAERMTLFQFWGQKWSILTFLTFPSVLNARRQVHKKQKTNNMLSKTFCAGARWWNYEKSNILFTVDCLDQKRGSVYLFTEKLQVSPKKHAAFSVFTTSANCSNSCFVKQDFISACTLIFLLH